MTTIPDLTRLSDAHLLNEVARAARNERQATAHLIALLGELDARRLYLGAGCASLFTYCTQVLHLSEHAAYHRIEAARAARAYPIVLELLADGSLTLTAVGLLRQHLTPENHRNVLAAATHKSKREVEELVARLRSQPPVPSSIRRVPRTGQPASSARPRVETALFDHGEHSSRLPQNDAQDHPARVPAVPLEKAPIVRALGPECYKLQFTISSDTHWKLRQVQQLLRHQVPDGDPAEIFDRALTALLEWLQRTKFAATERPRQMTISHGRSRHIPAAVRRAVWQRDAGRCAFVGANGRCTETGFLEFHHVDPYAAGGKATVGHIQLRCRAHNQYESELFFGTFGPTSAEDRGPSSRRRNSVRTELCNEEGSSDSAEDAAVK